MARPRLRSALVASVAGVLLVGLVGCSGDDEPGVEPATPSPTAPSSAPTTSASTSADPSAYLPTPPDVELTAPGTVLDFGEAALAAWKPRQDVVGVVGVRVDKVEKTSVKKSLSTFTLDAAARASTPYFVSLTVGNGGDTDLGGRQLPMYAIDSSGRLVPPTGVDQDFAACPGSLLPAIFAPGERARSCLIFLVPAGATLASVTFRPPEGVVPITWTGKVRSYRAPARPTGSPTATASPTEAATP